MASIVINLKEVGSNLTPEKDLGGRDNIMELDDLHLNRRSAIAATRQFSRTC